MNQISLIDTHSHYNSFIMNDLDVQIKLANNNEDVFQIINVGLDTETSMETVQISLKHPKFYSTLGIHPLYEGQVESLIDIYYKYDNTKIL